MKLLNSIAKKAEGKKRVLWFVPMPPPFAGPEIVSKYLFEAYSQKYDDAVLINTTLRTANNQKGKLDLQGILGTLKIYLRLVKALIKHNPELVYLLFASSKLAFLRDTLHILTAKAFGCQVVGHYRGGNFQGFYRGQKKYMQRFIRTVLKKTDSIVVLGRCLAKPFKEIDPNLHVEALYNGLPAEHFAFCKNRHEPETVNLFFMGHLTFAKGFYDLIVVFKRLLEKHPAMQLHIAGTPYSRSNAAQIASFLNGDFKQFYLRNLDRIHDEIDDLCSSPDKYHVVNHGIVDFNRKLEIFSHTDIFVLPSYTEGFPISVLEAMFTGVPVVVTNVGALPEVIGDGENGFVVDVGDTSELQNRLETLALSPELRQRIGQNNAGFARQRFSIANITNDLRLIFSSTLHSSSVIRVEEQEQLCAPLPG